jgi:hypothetical protein
MSKVSRLKRSGCDDFLPTFSYQTLYQPIGKELLCRSSRYGGCVDAVTQTSHRCLPVSDVELGESGKGNPMIIDIDEDLRIDTTQTPEFTLQRRQVVKDPKSKNYGTSTWKPIGHYGRLDQALERAADHAIAGSQEHLSLIELGERLSTHFSKIRRAIKRIKAGEP